MPERSSTRRRFLQHAAAGGMFLPYVFTGGRAGAASPNDRFNVLAVGVRGRGAAVAIGAAHYGKVVASADVDSASSESFLTRLAEYQKDKPAVYRDYREALERADVDVVTIGTPDHWHAKILVDSLRAGKDVYCEKPMTLTIDEGKLVSRVVRETGGVVQIGTQQRSEYEGRFLKAVALARSGRLGDRLTATVLLPPQYGRDFGPFPFGDPPETLDWDFWLGPVRKLPYCQKRCHGSWRNFVETGHGPLTDWGVHQVDIAQWALGAEGSGPLEVRAGGAFPQGRQTTLAVLEGRPPDAYQTNHFSTVVEYQAELKFAGGHVMRIEGTEKSWQAGKRRIGVKLEGDKGSLWVSRDELTGELVEKIESDPKQAAWLMEELVKLYGGTRPDWDHPIIRIADIMPTTHMEDFLAAIRSRRQPIADVFSHHRSNTSCILANAAALLDRELTWDPKSEQFVGDDQAGALLSRPQRQPYAVGASSFSTAPSCPSP